LDKILYLRSFETIFVQDHTRDLTKKLPFTFHLECAILVETSHEDNNGLP